MRFVIDAQLPATLVEGLAARGHEAEHVDAALGRGVTDAELVAYAMRHDAVLITKDADFLDLQDQQRRPQILWVRAGNVTNAALRALLTTRWAEVEAALLSGSPVVELRG